MIIFNKSFRLIKKLAMGTILITTFLSLSINVYSNEKPGKGKSVQPSRANWDTFWFGGAVLEIGLEKLGYKVKSPKTLTSATRYPALGNGDVDYSSDAVMPNATNFFNKVEDSVELIGPIMNPGSIQGYLIDKKTSEKYNITNINEMKNPEIVKIFDSDRDGKANLVGCNPGWNCDKIATHHLKAYGLNKTVQHMQGEYNILVGDAVARYKNGQPVFLYAWYPNTATVQMLPGKDLVWLQVPYTDLPMEGNFNTKIEGVVGCAAKTDLCNLGWTATQYFIAANKDWLSDNPAARKLFELVKMNLGDRVDQNMKMKNGEDSKKDIMNHARQWIRKNQSKFDSWIKEASSM